MGLGDYDYEYRSCYPKVGRVSALSDPVKPSQTQSKQKRRLDPGLNTKKPILSDVLAGSPERQAGFWTIDSP
jgi:hypothetical protein